MSTGDGTRLFRRSFGLVLVGLAASLLVPRIVLAQDAANAMRELAESTDFRVRVSAALYLGRTRPAGARAALEHALSDAHPAVRVAAAAALGTLGDAAAIAPLSRRLSEETSASVRAQITSTVERLRSGVAAGQGDPDAPPAQLGPDARVVVRLGTMRNGSGVGGEEMRRVLQRAAHTRARVLKGAAVVGGDAALLAQASARHLPVLTLDGSLQALTESRVADSVEVQARVEFAIRREQTLRGTLSGAATTFGSGQSLSDQSRRQLEDDAVDGAVQSAMRGAEQGLLVAAR